MVESFRAVRALVHLVLCPPGAEFRTGEGQFADQVMRRLVVRRRRGLES